MEGHKYILIFLRLAILTVRSNVCNKKYLQKLFMALDMDFVYSIGFLHFIHSD